MTISSPIHIRILSPTQTFYDGIGLSISAVNDVGPFDILANHANFFSLLTECTVLVNDGNQIFAFPIKQGIIRVANNEAALYVDIISPSK